MAAVQADDDTIQMVCVLLRVPVILLIHMSREFGFACVGVCCLLLSLLSVACAGWMQKRF